MIRPILLVLLLLMSSYPGLSGQTRINPPGPGPVFGPSPTTPRPIFFPVIQPRGPRARFDLLTTPSVLWAVAWTENRLFDWPRDPFTSGVFGFVHPGFIGGVGRRGFGFTGTTRIESYPTGYWTPYGAYGYGAYGMSGSGYGYAAAPYFTVDPYGNPLAIPASSTAPSNPYGSYAPWSPTSGNPYGTYATPPPGSRRPATPPEP